MARAPEVRLHAAAGAGGRRARRRSLGILTATLTLAAAPAAATSDGGDLPAWAFTSYLEEGGLGGQLLMQVAFEADGVAWIAGADGLHRYDGYEWRRFSRADGLPSDYVRAVTIDASGALWVGTDAGTGRFDGERWDDSATAGKLAGPSVRRIVAAPDGALWFCCDQWPERNVPAGLTRLADGRATTWTAADGLPSDYVSDVFVDSRGAVHALTSAGLARLDGERFSRPLAEAGLEHAGAYAWSMVEDDAGRLLVSHAGGMFLGEDGSWRHSTLANGQVPFLLESRDGAVIAAAWNGGIEFTDWSDGRPRPLGRVRAGHEALVHHAAEAPDGSVWALGLNLLVRWQRDGSEWQAFQDLREPLGRDAEGGIWFSSRDGSRTLRSHAGRWTSLDVAPEDLAADPTGGVWVHDGARLIRWTAAGTESHGAADLGLARIQLLRVDRAGRPWVAGRGADGGRPTAVVRVAGDWRRILLSESPDASVREARPDIDSGVWYMLKSPPGEPIVVHADESGARAVDLPRAVRPEDPVGVMSGSDGALWVYGFFGLFTRARDDAAWRQVDGLPGRHVFHVEELGTETWVSTLGTTGGRSGLVRITPNSKEVFEDAPMHLVGRRGNRLLVYATLDRLALAEVGSGRPPVALRLPSAAPVTFVVPDGDDLWVGTTEGVLRYRPDGIAPETRIASDVPGILADEIATLRVETIERFRTHASTEGWSVSHRIDGGAWSPFVPTRGELSIGPLEVGEHFVEVRAMDAGGDVDPTPAVLSLQVWPVPLQDRPWFVPTFALLTSAIAVLALVNIAARRRLRLLASGLEETVRERTVELTGSERKYRSLFEQSRDAICLLGPDGRIDDVNHAAAGLFGQARDALIGRGLRELVDLPEGPMPGKALAGRVRPPESETADVSVTASERLLDDGSPGGLQVMLRNVTEHLRLEERLRQSHKMEAIGRMAGGIAHDFNNMLTAILGFAELLVENPGDGSNARAAGEQILKEGRRAKALVGQIQAFSRGRALPPPDTDLHARLAELRELLGELVGHEVRLVLDPGPPDSLVRIEPAQFEQIVVNLAVNARDAMARGGTLRIALTHAVLDRAAAERAGAPAPGDYVCLRVEDEGAGIARDVLPKIFEPFFTTKSTGSGSGLGLAIVYGIVQQARGAISVASDPVAGTRFRIMLPRVSSAKVDEPPSPLPRPRAGRSSLAGKRVLVVDDEPVVREFIARTLANAGCSADQAPDGERALEALGQGGARYDLLITDIVMPRMDGRELARQAAAVSPETSVLFVSGHVDVGVEEDTPRPLLSKPFDGSTLLSAVESLDA